MSKALSRISLDEALERINNRFKVKKGHANLSIRDAINLKLASDIVCDSDVPPLPVSMVDGFAFDAESARLKVVGKVGPGGVYSGKIEGDQAIEVLTGAFLPAGIKYVAPKEHVKRNGDTIELSEMPATGENIMPAGFDCKSNEIIAKGGENLSPGIAYFLNYLKVATVAVKPQARAGIFSVGNELTDNSSDRQKVSSSNPIFLTHVLENMGVYARDLGILNDDVEEISENVKRQASSYDLLITSGGSSVGERDLMKEALLASGAEQVFHGLKLKPGRTGGLYVLNEKPIIVTSGNIQASTIETAVIGEAVLRALGFSVDRKAISAVIDRDVYFDAPPDFYNVAWLKVYELKNEIIASPVFSYSTSRSIPFRANSFTIVKSGHVKKNTVLDAYMIGSL
ncbi:MAG: molybdopterin molybdotransferase MoeA [Nitrososphaerota archaeon]|nr:molybdopterin molybdotransferase MoeA [Nitrososphaerota archaeon]MDG6931413.1 molybdopterin molybdotransferase MoeA [Nitrososphaerota archaeon]MDG6936789.1 molybdopterin molybdotransferase MoeA [Nitrososphaerota archaeon]MDG6943645.1 molybdopterin molybdotransferase MoeA [Nitrososphaerota archaeon]